MAIITSTVLLPLVDAVSVQARLDVEAALLMQAVDDAETKAIAADKGWASKRDAATKISLRT